MEAAAESIRHKPKAKCSVPWESITVTENRDDMKNETQQIIYYGTV